MIGLIYMILDILVLFSDYMILEFPFQLELLMCLCKLWGKKERLESLENRVITFERLIIVRDYAFRSYPKMIIDAVIKLNHSKGKNYFMR